MPPSPDDGAAHAVYLDANATEPLRPSAAAAMLEAAKDTLAEIEDEAIRTRLRRGGQQASTPTGNLVASLFIHDTTRALADGRPDPHDHIHAFLHNATWVANEGRWYRHSPLVMRGPGAGRDVTAGAIQSDINRLAQLL